MENYALASALKKRGSLKNGDRKYMYSFLHQAMLPHLWGHTINKQSFQQQWFCFSRTLSLPVRWKRGRSWGRFHPLEQKHNKVLEPHDEGDILRA